MRARLKPPQRQQASKGVPHQKRTRRRCKSVPKKNKESPYCWAPKNQGVLEEEQED